ncbi:hypothetical protein LINGRAHAP2_LOCUS10327, partial [Linum grandiflorum]
RGRRRFPSRDFFINVRPTLRSPPPPTSALRRLVASNLRQHQFHLLLQLHHRPPPPLHHPLRRSFSNLQSGHHYLLFVVVFLILLLAGVFLNVQAAFKRHRPLGIMQGDGIKPRRMLGPQRQAVRNLASNMIPSTGKSDDVASRAMNTNVQVKNPDVTDFESLAVQREQPKPAVRSEQLGVTKTSATFRNSISTRLELNDYKRFS